tara:strand:- start:9 stop:269 length:261 start_codon:yes stop_codon:yes gene_type:complete
MGGIFKKKKAPAPAPAPVAETVAEPMTPTEEVIERKEKRAEAQEITEMKGAQRRRRLMRRGGMRLLFSPLRQEGPGINEIKKKLGG